MKCEILSSNFLKKVEDISLNIESKLMDIYNNIFFNSLPLSNNIDIYKKKRRDIVTNVDIFIESELKNFLKKILLDFEISEYSIFLSEEEYSGKGKLNSIFQRDEFIWIVDPLDGTINFVNLLPFFSTSIALYYGKKPILGLVFAPKLGICYKAITGLGAKIKTININTDISQLTQQVKNKEDELPIFVSTERFIENSLISINLTSHYSDEENREALKIIEKLNMLTRGVRIFVSGALEMCFVADGRLNAFISNKADIFSIAGAYVILKESGGKLANFNGKEDDILSSKIIASNKFLLNKIKNIINTLEMPYYF